MKLLSFLTLNFVLIGAANACDLCGVYNSLETQKLSKGSVHVGLAEQFTFYGTTRESGSYLASAPHEHLASSITQIFGAYDLTSTGSLQLNIPYIDRRYRRLEDGSLSSGVEAGIGDITVIYKQTVTTLEESDYRLQAQILAGIKLPTGDSDQLKEEHETTMEHLHGTDHEEEMEPNVDMPTPESAIHGHDLALGTGSVDFPFGGSVLVRAQNFLLAADAVYTIRNEGDHSYRMANDFLWSISPGYFLMAEHDNALIAKLNINGEYKRKDWANGDREDATAIRAIFAGPGLIASFGTKLNAELSWDIPFDINSSGTQVTADYRVRAALNVRF